MPEGTYNVQLRGLSSDAYVSGLRLGPANHYDDGAIPLQEGAQEKLQVTVSRGAATVEGTVLNAIRQGTSASVFLVPEGRRRQNPLFYQTAKADNSGAFQLRSIAPGDYKLFAFEAAPPEGALENSEFIARHEQRGVRVTLQERQVLSGVTVPWIPR